MRTTRADNEQLAGEIRHQLQRTGLQLVCAESCTAGLVAATLAQWPGISGWLCGSWVVYQTDIKHQWLGIDSQLLSDPQIGPVSREVTALLAQAALARTPQATLAVAVTGHLGPGAPVELDGMAYVALARRDSEKQGPLQEGVKQMVERHVSLSSVGDFCEVGNESDNRFDTQRAKRLARMDRAVNEVLRTLEAFLQSQPSATK
jgi:nicotinamide-nucleotide amidase